MTTSSRRYSPQFRPQAALVPPQRSVAAIDLHACGQVGRVVFGGVPPLDPPGRSIAERAIAFRRDFDGLRRWMLREPRGYPLDCLNLVLPADDPRADAGLIVMEQQDEYPTMSGSNMICVVTALLETGALPITGPETALTIETPGGLVRVTARCAGQRVTQVRFRNLPSFATELGATLEVPDFGTLEVDVAYGGMVFVHVDADRLGLEISADGARVLRDAGVAIGRAAREQLHFQHPAEPSLNYIEGTLFYGRPRLPENHLRTTAVLLSGMMDRAPCGTGVSSRLAALAARGALADDATLRVEGPLGTVYEARIAERCRVGSLEAVVPEIGGRAWITGFANYVLSADDPFPEGYLMTDLWPAEVVLQVAAET